VKKQHTFSAMIWAAAAAVLLSAVMTASLTGCAKKQSLELTELSDTEGSPGENDGDSEGNGQDAGSRSQDPATETDPQEADGTGTAGEAPADGADSGEPELIYVFVCGAVAQEGVYELPAGSRVYQAVEAAGGYAADADTSYINQADPVTDAQKLEIPTVEEAEKLREEAALAAENRQAETDAESGSGPDGAAAGYANNGAGQVNNGAGQMNNGAGQADDAAARLININTADEATLQTLPGIGATKAASIVRYREANGGFSSIEEIKKVSGIGDITYENIKGCITV
jgi:competence protein ComEA